MPDNTYESRQTRFGYAEQSVFATAEADGVAVSEVTCDPFDIDPDVMIAETPHNHGTRQPVEQTTSHSTQGSASKLPVNGPIELTDIDQFAYAHFQKVIEAGAGTYEKTFTYFVDHPDFSADSGHFLTWMKRMPEDGTSQKVKGCIATRFKISGERNEMMMFETEWVGLGTTEDSATPSGTWTPTPGDGTNYLYFNSISSATLTHGASLSSPVALSLASFEVEGTFDHEQVGHDATNGFEQHGMKNRSGTFKIKMLRDATADQSLISMKEGELIQFDVAFGTTVTISVTGKIESLEYDTEGLLVNEITCRMLSSYTTGSVGECFTLVIANSVDRGWPDA
jgi:hypothetical protein